MKKFFKRFALFLIIIVIIAALSYKSIGRRMFSDNYGEIVSKYAKEYDVDPYLILSVIKAESNFDSNATSRQNAKGLMQVTPPTAKWIVDQMGITEFNDESLYDPEINIKLGTWYLKNLEGEFGENLDLVLASYNGGRGNVNKWLKDINYSRNGTDLHSIPFKETDNYVKKVKFYYKIYNRLYEY